MSSVLTYYGFIAWLIPTAMDELEMSRADFIPAQACVVITFLFLLYVGFRMKKFSLTHWMLTYIIVIVLSSTGFIAVLVELVPASGFNILANFIVIFLVQIGAIIVAFYLTHKIVCDNGGNLGRVADSRTGGIH